MHDQELEQALKAIPPLLDARSHEGREPLTAPALVDALRDQGIGEEAVRLAMWYLIDQGVIDLTDDWRVQPRANYMLIS